MKRLTFMGSTGKVRGRPSLRTLLGCVAALIVAVLTMVLLPSPANADSGAGNEATDSAEGLPELEELERDRPEAGLGGGDDGNPTTLAIEFSPAGCEGTTHNPHESTNEAVVKADTQCVVNVNALEIYTTLHRSRWYGWQRMDNSKPRVNSGVRAIRTNIRVSCRGTTHDWQGRTYHESLEVGNTYYASTQKTTNSIVC